MGSVFGGAVDLAAHMQAKQAAADDLTKGIDVYDSEVLAIEQVLLTLTERAQVRRNFATFDKEIRQRFEDIGFVVDVLWYETDVKGVNQPEIVIKARTEARPFDRDQMTHEVTHDLLELGEGGVIATDKAKVEAMRDGSYQGQPKGAHKHC